MAFKLNITPKVQIVVESICILIILSFCCIIYFHGKDLDCNKCSITFKQTRMLGAELDTPKIIKVHLVDLYNHLSKENKCIVGWDRTNGYIDKTGEKTYDLPD